MATLFQETFDCRHGNLPSGWLVEKNSDLSASGVRRAEGTIELLSAGNKFIPVIPDIHDCKVEFKVGINYSMGKSLGIFVCFRYDVQRRRGQAVRIHCPHEAEVQEKKLEIEYGFMEANRFTPSQTTEFPRPAAKVLDKPFNVVVEVSGSSLDVSVAGCEAHFAIPAEGSGKIALSRMHFFDVMKIMSFRINTKERGVCLKRTSFTVPLPKQTTMYPIFCDVSLADYGDCMEAGLSFRGGVAETEPGEGNYHVLRADMISRPFLKVITAEQTDEFVVYDEDFINVVKNLAPDYFYKVLHKRAPWPLKRNVRFMKPDGDFDLAVGFESFCHSPMKNYAQSPSETQFRLNGDVVYSGEGMSDGKITVSFLSNPKKRFAAKLPKSDPRYAQAKAFLAANHFFMEGETMNFRIELRGKKTPIGYEVTLEDAYFRKLKTLSFQEDMEDGPIGVMAALKTVLTVSPIRKLSPGVYHLRVRSTDPTIEQLEDYCALEVMGNDAGALPPPLISGLPYLYNSRTETRGLLTDGFDVWQGESMDEPHYLSCANFLPPAARKFQIAPTVHAYGREYFCWLGSRCCDNYKVADNMDLVAQADYVNGFDELNQRDMVWRYVYAGWELEQFIEFAKGTGDPAYDIPALEKLLAEGKYLDLKTYTYMVEHHWEEWMDVMNHKHFERAKAMLEKMRKVNPKVRFSKYGPAHIYAGHLKGPEFIRQMQLDEELHTDMVGFEQFEDYPFACDYGLERGVYFLIACLLTEPNARIYPEIYTEGGIQGCPDGAVYYAYPPFGRRTGKVPVRMTRQVYEFALGTPFYVNGVIRYWNQCGFQSCNFTRPWFEALLNGWRVVQEYPPAKPMRTPVFFSSAESRRAHEAYVGGSPYQSINPVCNTAAEDVPYAYEQWRKSGGAAAPLAWLNDIEALSPDDVDFIVLPPLKGVPKKSIDAIRKLHEKGVGLLAFEDVQGLEDIFGVRDLGEDASVSHVAAEGEFMAMFEGRLEEFCYEPQCKGHYAADGCEVLLTGTDVNGGTMPVLTIKDNGAAKAAFFNVPPHLVRADELHERLGYSKDSISAFIDGAAQDVMWMLAKQEVEAFAGRLIAYHSTNGAEVVIVENPDQEKELLVDVDIANASKKKLVSCDKPYIILGEGDEGIYMQVRLPKEECAVIILK